MKKIMIILASLMLISSLAFAQDVMRTFNTDEGGYIFYAIQGPEVVPLPLPDGNLVQVILDGGDGVMSPADQATGNPTGDDQLCLNNNFYEFPINGEADIGIAGAFWHLQDFIFTTTGAEPVANCGGDDYIYLRAWDGPTIIPYVSKYCNTSYMQASPACGLGPGFMEWPDWNDGQGDWVTLPVELSAFTANFLNNVPTLYWTTESETDNIGWNIYRNTENNFSTATKITSDLINGYGTTSEPHSYIYEDYIENAEPGDTYWYWLENVDLGGETHHYNRVASVEIKDGSQPSPPVAPILYEIKNSPNPFNPDINGRTKIRFTLSDAAFAEITIYNIRGKKVKTLPLVVASKDVEATAYWNGKDENGRLQSSGIYLYELKVNGKSFSTQRLMVIR